MDRSAAPLGEERLEIACRRRPRPARRPRAGWRSPGRSTARGSSRAPRRRSPRGPRRAGTRRARPSCPSRIANSWIGRLVVLRGPARRGRARSGRTRPSSGSPSSARWPGSCPERWRRARTPGPLRGRRHLACERLDQRLLAALEEQLDLGDVGPVGVLRDGLDARALAALDVVQQARPLEGPLAVLDVDRAGPEREQPADEVHRLVDARGRRVRPEVAAPVVDQLARPLDAREVVARA